MWRARWLSQSLTTILPSLWHGRQSPFPPASNRNSSSSSLTNLDGVGIPPLEKALWTGEKEFHDLGMHISPNARIAQLNKSKWMYNEAKNYSLFTWNSNSTGVIFYPSYRGGRMRILWLETPRSYLLERRRDKPADCVMDKNKIASAAQFSLTYSQRYTRLQNLIEKPKKKRL